MSFESTENPPQPPVEIPLQALSPEALDGIMDNFILREGTDYGRQEVAYAARVAKLRFQIEHGDVKIVFDPDSDSVTLLTVREWQRLSRPLST